MKFNQRKQEKGSILMEVIAVVAVLGVMGPLLFKQVSDRNTEIENINIASEVRTIKEAFSAYIMSYKADIIASCTTDGVCENVNTADVQRFLPAGFSSTLDDYNLKLLRTTMTDGSIQLQGFIIPELDNMGLEGMTVRQAGRIANLIGADGGIKRRSSNEINGTGGSWSLEAADIGLATDANSSTFLATTGLDTFSPEVRVEDFDQANIFLPNSLGLEKLHAWNYFSIGGGDSESNNRCFQLNHASISEKNQTLAKDDIIYEAGAGNEKGGNCDPLFWVSSNNTSVAGGDSDGDNNTSGDVFVKQDLRFRSSPNQKSSIIISSGHEANSGDAGRHSSRHILVYDFYGNERIRIDGSGKILSRGVELIAEENTVNEEAQHETLVLQNGRIESNVYAPNASASHSTEANDGKDHRLGYKLDPRYTSVMNDIRLESRGGARLSELLPTYSLVGIQSVDGPNIPTTINKPKCPTGHTPAIAVMPVKWNAITEKEIVSAVNKNMTISGTSLIQDATKTASNTARTWPIVKIENNEKYTDRSEGINWVVTLDYNDTTIESPITALAYTYCYFDPASLDIDSQRARNRGDDSGVVDMQ